MTEKKTILIVEDEEVVRELLMDGLGEGYNYLQAANGKKGLETFLASQVDIVISDIRMPEMDGLKMLAEIRKHNTVIPVIIITGHGDQEAKATAWLHGAYDFIHKPFSINAIREVIKKAILFGEDYLSVDSRGSKKAG